MPIKKVLGKKTENKRKENLHYFHCGSNLEFYLKREEISEEKDGVFFIINLVRCINS